CPCPSTSFWCPCATGWPCGAPTGGGRWADRRAEGQDHPQDSACRGRDPRQALFGPLPEQEGLELAALQGGLGGVGHQGEVGHQGGGLALRVVLSEGDEIDVLPGEQGPDAGGGGGQP